MVDTNFDVSDLANKIIDKIPKPNNEIYYIMELNKIEKIYGLLTGIGLLSLFASILLNI